jgi:hypothetical protein
MTELERSGMASGWLMLIIGNLIALGVFLNGFRFSRVTTAPFKELHWFGRTISDPKDVLEKTRLIGKVQMFLAPMFALFWGLMLSGAFGPVSGIQTLNLS